MFSSVQGQNCGTPGLRIKGLVHLDPLTVPLPNGTEVVTRVDRLLGERRVPEGASSPKRSMPSQDACSIKKSITAITWSCP